MFCEKCGNKLMYDSLYCENCGARISSVNDFGFLGGTVSKNVIAFIGTMCVVAVFCIFTLNGGNSEQTIDDIDTNTETAQETINIQTETDNGSAIVESVKNVTNSSYPGITYGEAFDSFFGSPNWRYFKGTDESTGEMFDVIEFTGTCSSNGESGEALIQFVLYDDGTFSPVYFTFNDEAKSTSSLDSLVKAVFENSLPEESTQSDFSVSADTQYYGTGYTITLSSDWVQQSSYETGEYDLSFVNYTDPGNINVYVTNDGYDNMGLYLNHIDGADGQFFLNDQVYEEMNDRYYTEYYFSADGNYHMGCYAGTDSHIYIFSFTTNDKTTYYKLRDSVKNSFASASLY
ncbi:MAG: hypothetical protein LIO44_06385 [Eubacterium sp.]|nr:hypothetical protein [Eubacterium sp.]